MSTNAPVTDAKSTRNVNVKGLSASASTIALRTVVAGCQGMLVRRCVGGLVGSGTTVMLISLFGVGFATGCDRRWAPSAGGGAAIGDATLAVNPSASMR